MTTINIFNIVNHLQKCVQINYKNSYSKLIKLEINLAESLFEIIENYIKSIDDDIENGELIDFDSNVCDDDNNEDMEISDFEDELEETKVSTWLILTVVIIFFF